jgi:hypothetical protein
MPNRKNTLNNDVGEMVRVCGKQKREAHAIYHFVDCAVS